jgi:hypothetical protein
MAEKIDMLEGGAASESSLQKPIGYLRHFDHSTVGESPL